MTEPVSVLALGGCLLHGPLNPTAAVGDRMTYPKYGPVPGVYTFGEMFQVIEVLRGQKDVPAEIRPLCAMRPAFTAVPNASDFRDVDVALLEPSSPVEITFRGYNLNRAAVAQNVTNPIRAKSREAAKWVGMWFRNGLMSLNEKLQAEAAEKLLGFVTDDMENADLARAVIREARSAKSDVLNGFRRMQELVGRPIGVVVYIFQYFPDGRAVSWPAGFHEEVADAAQKLDLPYFEPSNVVVKYGVQAALRPDLRHYNDEFTPVMADALVEFAETVFNRPARAAAE